MTETACNVIIGLDVAKDKLDIHYSNSGRHEVIKNNPRAIGAWIKRTQSELNDMTVVLEPTGGYESLVVRALTDKAVSTARVHPNKVYHYHKAAGDSAKTDKISAKVLADYFTNHPDKAVYYGGNYRQNKELAELDARLNQLKDIHQAEANRLRDDLISKDVVKSIKQSIKHVARRISELEAVISDYIAKDAKLTRKAELLKSYSGVGEVIANALVLAMPELGKLSKTQAAALIGTAPLNNDSGKKYGKRSIRGGRFYLRKKLYMGALTATRFNPELKTFYEALLARGKLKKVAIVAVMRKMICQLNAMLRDDRPWHGITN